MDTVCASVFSLLVVVVMVRGQCTQSTCTKQCYPNLWERDLCHFYLQVSSWRESAEQCGIALPAVPVRSTQLSPQLQWDEARLYWEQLRSAWQRAAKESGLRGVSVVEDGGSGSPSTLSPEGVDLGSGVATTQPLLEPSATPVITSRNSQLSQWLTSSASWKNDYVQWESFARSESGLQLPDSTVCDIVDRFNNSLRASDVRQNSAAWFSLLTNWRQGYDTYNGTFHGLCPNL